MYTARYPRGTLHFCFHEYVKLLLVRTWTSPEMKVKPISEDGEDVYAVQQAQAGST